VAGSHMVTLVSQCQLAVQTYSGRSSCEKPSQTEFELNQTNTNGFNWFRFQFQKFWLKPNSLVSGLGKNGLNQTKPNFPNTTGDVLKKAKAYLFCPQVVLSSFLSTSRPWLSTLLPCLPTTTFASSSIYTPWHFPHVNPSTVLSSWRAPCTTRLQRCATFMRRTFLLL